MKSRDKLSITVQTTYPASFADPESPSSRTTEQEQARERARPLWARQRISKRRGAEAVEIRLNSSFHLSKSPGNSRTSSKTCPRIRSADSPVKASAARFQRTIRPAVSRTHIAAAVASITASDRSVLSCPTGSDEPCISNIEYYITILRCR